MVAQKHACNCGKSHCLNTAAKQLMTLELTAHRSETPTGFKIHTDEAGFKEINADVMAAVKAYQSDKQATSAARTAQLINDVFKIRMALCYPTQAREVAAKQTTGAELKEVIQAIVDLLSSDPLVSRK